MNGTIAKHKISKPVQVIIAIIFWIVIWQVISMMVAKDYIVPTPIGTLKKFFKIVITADFWLSALMTLLRVTVGLAASFALGLIGAALAYKFQIVRAILSSISAVFKATPVMSVIMFLLIFLVSGAIPVVVCFLMCFPVFYTSILAGFDSVERQYKEVAKEYTDSVYKQVRYALIPMSRAHIKSSIAISSGIAWKSVVAAEVLSSPGISMGQKLLEKKSLLLTDELIAWTIGIVILSVVFTFIVKKIFK